MIVLTPTTTPTNLVLNSVMSVSLATKTIIVNVKKMPTSLVRTSVNVMMDTKKEMVSVPLV